MEFDKNYLKINLEITPEVARIHAHICGDGSFYTTTEKRSPGTLLKHKRRDIIRTEHVIEYYNEYSELRNEFKRDFKIAFNRNILTKNKKIKVRGSKWIAEKLELTQKSSYNWYIPKFITNSSKTIISYWLRAFFDDEGYINHKSIYLVVVNKKGIIQIQGLLKRLEIESILFKPRIPNNPRHHTAYRIGILGPNVIKFYKLINFIHPRKNEKLKEIVKKKWGVRNSQKCLKKQFI